jgi:hypothetical protein
MFISIETMVFYPEFWHVDIEQFGSWWKDDIYITLVLHRDVERRTEGVASWYKDRFF